MIDVKVLGPGCMKCNKLYEMVGKAVETAGVEAQLEKVQKLDQIMSYGVMLTPALVVDGEVKISGRLPREEEIVAWLGEKAAKE